jgi:hypothetical protein
MSPHQDTICKPVNCIGNVIWLPPTLVPVVVCTFQKNDWKLAWKSALICRDNEIRFQRISCSWREESRIVCRVAISVRKTSYWSSCSEIRYYSYRKSAKSTLKVVTEAQVLKWDITVTVSQQVHVKSSYWSSSSETRYYSLRMSASPR